MVMNFPCTGKLFVLEKRIPGWQSVALTGVTGTRRHWIDWVESPCVYSWHVIWKYFSPLPSISGTKLPNPAEIPKGCWPQLTLFSEITTSMPEIFRGDQNWIISLAAWHSWEFSKVLQSASAGERYEENTESSGPNLESFTLHWGAMYRSCLWCMVCAGILKGHCCCCSSFPIPGCKAQPFRACKSSF